MNGMYSTVSYRPQNNPREGIDYVSEHDFHTLYQENEGAGVILQGFVRMVDNGEAYGYIHTFLTIDRLNSFFYAFGKTPKSKDIAGLWEEIRALFGMSTTAEANKIAKEKSDKAGRAALGQEA